MKIFCQGGESEVRYVGPFDNDLLTNTWHGPTLLLIWLTVL